MLNEMRRAALRARFDTLAASAAGISAAMAPLQAALDAVMDVRDELFAEAEAECFVAPCEVCNRVLIEGDKGYAYEDGPYLCADHAPTWADVKEMWETYPADDEDASAALARVRAHLDAGGALTDKVTHDL